MKNQNNQTIAYKCSSNLQNVENFESIGGGSVAVVVGQRYPIAGNPKGNENLNNMPLPENYNNVFQVNQGLAPFRVSAVSSENKIDFWNLQFGATAEGLGKYGEDWIYVVTGPMIPKNTYIITIRQGNVSTPGNSQNTWIVTTKSIGGVYKAGAVAGQSVNIYLVTKTPFGPLHYSIAEFFNKDYNAAGSFIGTTAALA